MEHPAIAGCFFYSSASVIKAENPCKQERCIGRKKPIGLCCWAIKKKRQWGTKVPIIPQIKVVNAYIYPHITSWQQVQKKSLNLTKTLKIMKTLSKITFLA